VANRNASRRPLARPGGNTTGFTAFEYSISSKWLEMLKQIAPRVTRVEVLRDAAISSGIGQFAVIHPVAPSFGVELSPYDTRDAVEIERAFAAKPASFCTGPRRPSPSSGRRDDPDRLCAFCAAFNFR
jgi:hypothetical protein